MAPPPLQTRFSTVSEVAAMLRVSKMTIYRMIEREDLPHVRIGKNIRIPTAGIWRYLAEQDLSPVDAPYDANVTTTLRAV